MPVRLRHGDKKGLRREATAMAAAPAAEAEDAVELGKNERVGLGTGASRPTNDRRVAPCDRALNAYTIAPDPGALLSQNWVHRGPTPLHAGRRIAPDC